MPVMSAVTASELAQIQTDAAATLDQTCQILASTRTPKASGGASQVWASVETTRCSMAQPTGTQLQNYDYLVGSLSTWQVKLPVGTNVSEQNRVVIAGQTLNVVKVLAPRSYPALLTVLAVEVK